MPRTSAKLNQADIARVLRAAKAIGAKDVKVLPDGSLRVELIEEVPTAKIDGSKRSWL